MYYYRARVPTNVLHAIASDLATWRRHTVRSGDTLFESWRQLVGKDGGPKKVLWMSSRQSSRKEAEIAFARKQVELNDLYEALRKISRRQGPRWPTLSG